MILSLSSVLGPPEFSESVASLPGGRVSPNLNRLERNDDGGMLRYMLLSVARNAPWVRRIHVLINCPAAIPTEWRSEPFFDRVRIMCPCAFMPKDTCSTKMFDRLVNCRLLYA